MIFQRHRGRSAAAVFGTGALLAATACGGGGSEAGGDVTLVVETFGTFGYEKLYQDYEAEHPNINIEERNVQQLDDYAPRLEQNIGTGSGAGDIVAIEEGILAQYMANPDNFVNLLDYGGGEMEEDFLPWKWQMALTPDEEHLVGLGTDIGGLAMCYNRDLFEEAGLPTDRDEVGKLWETWDDFIAAGEKFKESGTDAKFLDTVTSVYNANLMQQNDHTYFDRDDNLVIKENQGIKDAYDMATELAEQKLTADLESFSEDWGPALQQNAFAVTACPAWALGLIEDSAGPELSGVWDVAEVPGGGGNWGGSWLAVPTQSEHPEEAAELAKFLTTPESHIAVFKKVNNLPSSIPALEDPAVQEYTNEYFNDAPVGQIFAKNAKGLEPVYLGPANQPVRQAVEDTLRAMDSGELSPDEAWDRAVEEAKREGR